MIKQYYKESYDIQKQYPETEVFLFMDSGFLVSLTHAFSGGVSDSHLEGLLHGLIKNQRRAFLNIGENNEEYILQNEESFIAERLNRCAEESIKIQDKETIPFFIALSQKYSETSSVSPYIKADALQLEGHYHYQYTGDYIRSLNAYRELLLLNDVHFDDDYLKSIYNNIINTVNCATNCVRYFYKEQIGDINQLSGNYVPILSYKEVNDVLDIWEDIKYNIVSTHGKEYLDSLLISSQINRARKHVFHIYSSEDTELMRVHNHIRNMDNEAAYSLLEGLFTDNRLSDNEIIDILYNIDDNLYLHSGYKSAYSFLCFLEKKEIVTKHPAVKDWLITEKDRINDWIGYAVGYAQGLSEKGRIEEALKQYDYIEGQVDNMEARDSLLMLTNFYRALDLKNAGKFTEAIPFYEKADSICTAIGVRDYTYRHFTLNGLSWCYYKTNDLIKAEQYIAADCSFIDNYNGKADEVDLEKEWRSTHKNRGAFLLQLGRPVSAREQFSQILQKLEDTGVTSEDNEYIDVVCWITQAYRDETQKAFEESNPNFLYYYNNALSFLKSHIDVDDAYYYFDPYNDYVKTIITSIDHELLREFCEMVLSLDNKRTTYKLLRGIITKGQELQQKAGILGRIGFACLEASRYDDALYYYNLSINEILNNRSVLSEGEDLLTLDYELLSAVYQKLNQWENVIENRINAFYSSVEFNGTESNKSKKAFSSVKICLDVALEASISFVNAIYNDESHPHLDYHANIAILDKWKKLLAHIKDNYGTDYLLKLQTFHNNEFYSSWDKQYGNERPYASQEHLAFESEINYIECLLNIMADNLSAFSASYSRLLKEITPFSCEESVDQLRYELVKELANSLAKAGYSDWSFGVLENYWQYLVTEGSENFELAEKIKTIIGNSAWLMNDIERQMWATISAGLFVEGSPTTDYSFLFYDVNELILQLILYSRVQEHIDESMANKALSLAKNLVDKDIVLSNGTQIKKTTKVTLFNELAVNSHNHLEAAKYFNLAIENEESWGISSRLNLAMEYSRLDMIEDSDSLACEVLERSKDKFIEPRWKNMLCEILTYNSIKRGNSTRARHYSKEGLVVQINDYLKISQTLTSQARSQYWDKYYSNTLENVASVDMTIGDIGSNAYDAALFQKSILIRQKQAIKRNILLSEDQELKKAYNKYNQEIRSSSDSALVSESFCMYLYSLHPEFTQTFVIPDWQHVQNSLNVKDIAIEFSTASDILSGERFFIAIILRTSFATPKIVRLCKYDDIVSAITNHLDERGFSVGLYKDSSLLYKLLWEPLEDYLKGVNTVYYAPYDFINNINIEIASKKPGGKSIGKKYHFYRLSSTGELANKASGLIEKAIIFGDIDYNAQLASKSSNLSELKEPNRNDYSLLRGSLGGGWKYLPNTKQETDEIQKMLQSNNIYTTVYRAKSGSEEVFKSISSNAPDILHVATHGFYYSAEQASHYQYFNMTDTPTYNPGVRSGLILSGANHAWNGETLDKGSEDGILTADEICGIDLAGTQVLTLSACQTALGDLNSDGVYGLQRSFKIAGVNSIIMSLWQVDDEATFVMMDRFYHELVSGKDKHEAFRLAQSFMHSWAEKHVKELKEEISLLPREIQEKREKQYGGLLCPEYYWGAFVMLD